MVTLDVDQSKVLTSDDCHRFDASKVDKRSLHSVHVVGTNTPDKQFDVMLENVGRDVRVPLGKMVQNNQEGVHNYSEFCVYNQNQVKLRYIIKLRN